jgi:monoamine oxidase
VAIGPDSVCGMSQSSNVIVIGAGISGLAATRLLIDAGLTVRILEARDRIGGRLLSAESDEGRFDLGATWFWPGEQRVATLVDEFALATHPQHIAGDAVYQSAIGVERLRGNPIDVPSGRFSSGADSLARSISHELPAGTLLLGHPVRRIETTDDTTRAFVNDEAFIADQIVIALPPALAAHSIEFSPGLPERLAQLAAATPVWMGATTKVVACYATAFWRDRGLAGAGISHIGPMSEIHDMSGPDGSPAALFGFVSSANIESPTVTRSSVIEQLTAIFGPEAAEPLDVMIHDWRAETYTSPPGVERLTAFHTFGHSMYCEPTMGGRIHWASTETAQAAPGHIEGALQAANRAATAVLTRHAETSQRADSI